MPRTSVPNDALVKKRRLFMLRIRGYTLGKFAHARCGGAVQKMHYFDRWFKKKSDLGLPVRVVGLMEVPSLMNLISFSS